MTRVDLHLYQRISVDASIHPRPLVSPSLGHSSIESVAVTDPSTLKGYCRAEELASSYKDVLTSPELKGVQIREMHSSWSRGDASCFVRACDGSLSGRRHPDLNRMARNLAKVTGLPGVAAIGAYCLRGHWSAYADVRASLDTDRILKAVEIGSVRPLSNRKSIHF